MPRTIFITGGARSGKSRFAEHLARQTGPDLCYLATAQSLDCEMGERIKKHQLRRGDEWHTIEEPLELAMTLKIYDGAFSVILLDCLTLWLTNLLLAGDEQDDGLENVILDKVRQLGETLRNMTTPVIIVTNEVGMGIVPESRLGRVFRDLAGQANQIIAAAADEAWLLASGIPLKLK
ncbi:MAG: bifunctional adenosylcobinamide kinase/adenosylcobinamide-phosphate guanylyltransferase [Desulfuromonadales bacterium]|nr:bifunctional adenosylcobinamide kinase/adenosylcobinamide-phosphate guanylyltransferase [Desulfuromonadales bacterium]